MMIAYFYIIKQLTQVVLPVANYSSLAAGGLHSPWGKYLQTNLLSAEFNLTIWRGRIDNLKSYVAGECYVVCSLSVNIN